MNKHKVIIFTGPSGVGKATIEKELFKDKSLKLAFSCSATTRAPRQGEVEGEHYYFLSNYEFETKISANDFLEWNEHFDHKYGTLKSEVNAIINRGNVPFLEVDVDGAKKIIQKSTSEYQLVTIFIMPPSIDELERRIRQRNTESESQLQLRLKRYHEEIDARKIFQHIIINKDISETVDQIAKIIKMS